MSDRPLLIITLEGLATSAIGCYGSPWNSTPAIDTIAAGGCVFDRWIATRDEPIEQLWRWLQPDPKHNWADRWRERDPIVLLSDDERLQGEQADAFDETRLVPPSANPAAPCDEIDQTRFGQMIAAAVERDAEGPWSLMWLHSRFLSQCWDAPRDLFPVEAEEIESELESDTSDLEGEPAVAADTPPPIFDQVLPPHLELDAQRHPDLVLSWMRTYGCQIRLVDLLTEVLVQSLEAEDLMIVLAGTSGMCLGQNGWVGHQAGPLRSCDLRLPLVISDVGPIRAPGITSADRFPSILHQLADGESDFLSTDTWCRHDDEMEPPVRTGGSRSQVAWTTPRWQYVQDSDGSDHLFLKPDDVDDTNDVSSLRPDVLQTFSKLEANPASPEDRLPRN